MNMSKKLGRTFWVCECLKIIMLKGKKKNLSNATIFDEGGYHVQGHLAVADACRTPDCTGFLPFILSKKIFNYSLFLVYTRVWWLFWSRVGVQSLMPLLLLLFSSLSNISMPPCLLGRWLRRTDGLLSVLCKGPNLLQVETNKDHQSRISSARLTLGT